VFLRSATAYGASPRLRFDLVINNLVAWACTTGRVMLKSDGTPWRPVVHIRDISRAFIAVMEAPTDLVHCRAFNVASAKENYRVRELAEIVGETVPGATVTFSNTASPDVRNYRADGSLLARMFPAALPRWSARKGAAEVYRALLAEAVTVEDFEGPRFKRVAHVRALMERGVLRQDLRRAG
jgi:nucleoside-diphosphate-sugar epimerase